MIWVLLGIILGLLVGALAGISIPTEFTRYTAVILIGMLDAMFGAMRAEITQDKYNVFIFISGLIFNILLAIGITYLGDRLGLDLYLAATVVFTFRIFQNVGTIRRVVIEHWLNRRANAERLKKVTKITWKNQ
ncbi:small basic family protein [Candidatus Peregrinibacteria bacterium]|nr:small basic family protein [Candidatus Peregrinibacteria bacterium]